MHVNDIHSKRKLSIIGTGWYVGEIDIEIIMRHSCTNAVLDEKDFEWEEGDYKNINKYISFSNSMFLLLENLENHHKQIFEFKSLKKEGLYRGNLNPEDLILTNSFLKVPRRLPINHWNYEDEDYYIEFQESWNGIYSEYYFKRGEIFDKEKLDISTKKLDIGKDYFEWVCQVKYSDKVNNKEEINIKATSKKLRVR